MNAMSGIITHPQADTQCKPVNRSGIDISRGATQFGIRSRVLLQEELRDAYAEIDPTLGQNVIGIVLTVLACHLAMGQGGLSDDQITVCLIRREDDRLVEVDLGIHRHRQTGRECLSLRQLAEREVAERGGDDPFPDDSCNDAGLRPMRARQAGAFGAGAAFTRCGQASD